MTFRKVGVALLAASLLTASASSSQALPAPTPVNAATAVGAGPWIVGGFIGVVAALCLYDFILKVDGQKNWDGTSKKPARVR